MPEARAYARSASSSDGRFQKFAAGWVTHRCYSPSDRSNQAGIPRSARNDNAPGLQARANLTQFVQVDLGIEHFGGLHQLIPTDLMSRVSGVARHHARKRGLGAFGSLIMEFAAGDAFDEGLFLFGIGLLQIGSEFSRGGKSLVTGLLCGRGFPRSEEHTSELQSQSNLVCRLLLEKKISCTIPRCRPDP